MVVENGIFRKLYYILVSRQVQDVLYNLSLKNLGKTGKTWQLEALFWRENLQLIAQAKFQEDPPYPKRLLMSTYSCKKMCKCWNVQIAQRNGAEHATVRGFQPEMIRSRSGKKPRHQASCFTPPKTKGRSLTDHRMNFKAKSPSIRYFQYESHFKYLVSNFQLFKKKGKEKNGCAVI